MTDFVYRILLPTGLAASLVCVLVLALRPVLRLVPARQRRLAFCLAAVLFVLPLPAVFSGVAALVPTRAEAPAAMQALGQAAPAAPLYAVGEAIGGALDAPTQTAPAMPDATPKAGETGPAGDTAASAGALPFSPLSLLAGAYLLGLAVAAGGSAVRYALFLRRLRRASKPVQNPALTTLYKGLCGELGVKNPPTLLVSHAVSSPLLACAAKPVIVLPTALEADPAAAYALRHELCHHRHGDVPLKLLVQCVVALHWFNPLCYLLRREVNEVCEQACDEAVAEGLDSLGRKAYALALLQCAEARVPYAVAGFASPAKRLKKRLAHLLHPAKSRRAAKPVLLGTLAALTGLGLLAGCALQAGTQSATQPASSSIVQTAEGVTGQDSSQPESAAKATESAPPVGELLEAPVMLEVFSTSLQGDAPLYKLYPIETQLPTDWPEGSVLHVIQANRDVRETAEFAEHLAGLEAQTPAAQQLLMLSMGLTDEYEYETYSFTEAGGQEVPLSAVSDGKIAHIGEFLGVPYVISDVGGGQAQLYLFVDQPQVAEGQQVSENDAIGLCTDFAAIFPLAYSEAHSWLYAQDDFMTTYIYAVYGDVLAQRMDDEAMLAKLAEYFEGRYSAAVYTERDVADEAAAEDMARQAEAAASAAEMARLAEAVEQERIKAGDKAQNGHLTNPVPEYTELGRGLVDGHRGLDLLAEKGAAVCAAAAGTVVEAGFHYSYGNTILVDHGGGLYTRYAHCDTLTAATGQSVAAGEKIATVGSTGNTTNNTLHFEVIQQDENGEMTLADPLDYLPENL